MLVRVLGTYGYHGQHHDERGESISTPKWADVEHAIQQLNAQTSAGVVLHLEDYQDGDPARSCLHILGSRMAIWSPAPTQAEDQSR
jgi:hypothetical protein